MLGVAAGVDYSEQTLVLEPGDRLIMFTDGITEARRDSLLFDKEGVVERLSKIGEASPEDIAEALLQAATDHAGGELQDDVAIVVLGYEGSKVG